MQLRASLLLAAVAPMAWAKTIEMGQMGDVPADSKMGNKLLSSARRLGDQDERDQTWIAGYSLRFKSCHSVTTVPQEEGGEELQLYNSNVVVFQLCKTSSCGSQNDKCEGGAEYAINMALFLDAYTEAKMEKEEQICENIRENCYCDNANDEEVCENQCYVDQNADYCVEYEGQEEFEVQRYLECAEMENNERYFIGPYCASSGDAIHLGVFDDIGCVNHSEDGIYMFEKYMYRSLPFSSSDDSIVGNECVQCLQVDEDQNNNNNNNNGNNNNNNGQDAEIIEMCERLYEMSAKCEANLEYSGYSNYWYPDELACNYINNVLPRLDKVFGVKSSVRSSSSSGPAKAFAWIFGITTFALLGVCYWLYTKVQRTSVNLSSQGGTSV
eukprot:CAMPEP_0197438558 /NCGR_PEP_ID=MMETSP1175-20131217/5516_1 /TAXON_ID=1003142 /ORGANISM="Triceratium dubium, Strain CCMP147" /LENGTH=383 /DNA_ID=CAMNT_0042968309 /DNA_START=66 /DNA_END=1217 /DNA_ORIENTATION=+